MDKRNELIKQQLTLINDMGVYYGFNHPICHNMINALYETSTINPEMFSETDYNQMFLLIEKISKIWG